MNDLISIIITVYNIKDYIEQCLDSIMVQDYCNIELVVVDDGSTDGSGGICDKYAEKDHRIKVIHKQNEGLVRARKTGLRETTGRYIAYVDGDDWIEPDMIQKLYDIIKSQNVDIAMCGHFEDTGSVQKPVFHGIACGRYDKKALLESVYPRMIVKDDFFEWGIFPSVWGKLFKRECLLPYQLSVADNLTMGEDAACTYPTILAADSIYILQKCLYHYRQSVSSMVKEIGDPKVQRNRFKLLYHSVNQIFEKQRHLYDVREQWKDYLLFLMVPRAGVLYHEIEALDYLFPFSGVSRGSDVIIYGMGTFGQLLCQYIKLTGVCNIAACIDKNYSELNRQGIEAASPEDISKFTYDAIVVAASFSGVRHSIYKELTARYPEDKVHLLDEALIKSDETMAAFGLID